MNVSASRARLRWEIGIVLALSFGASAVYAIVAITERLTRDTTLAEQSTTINRSLAERPVFDLVYQLLAFGFGLAPTALVVFLLWRSAAPRLGRLGFGAPVNVSTGASRRWWLGETGWGVGLAALIGIPGIAFYLVSKAIGINLTVVPTSLDAFWWTVPVLVLQALRAALSEELIVVAYLFDRLRRLGLGTIAIILTSAVLRGSYHLYQGFGGFLGNVVMGIVFGWVYHRFGRILPLIVAHWILDIVSFAGYPLALALWPSLFGAP
ncbi:CAAX prenyl protease-like protein [Leucobacter luti]|uniref:CAAX prenyl protease-like protein n=1 Tax=Leucobacter luti TaxID=340320 RepID=A0A4R6S7V6_9MICO|nr:type II CAAX endopeptidase family protein [Leucobacter luti]MCW2288473.1 membrane protease YdiL (CAAX protease family) [Leucobacter luti]TCK45371.1 CAAX prenyl protease-like protein [Leucobacter luti]TDP95900.1 CAAX prenyl protease-like protein [Leucobacter luti]